MPNKDLHHDIVVRALQKAGWEIIKEQNYFSVGDSPETARRLYIDIKAKHITQAIVILIEVKDLDSSPVHELMEMIGQYIVYQAALDLIGDKTPLYVAIPEKAYQIIIAHPLVKKSLKDIVIPMFTYDPEKEELIRWIPLP